MTAVSCILAGLTVGICLYAAVSDIRHGVIRNMVLLIAGGAALIGTAICFLVFSHDDLLLYLENAGIVIAIALAGYFTRIWAGGDCKLTVFFAVAYPVLFLFDYNENRLTLWSFIVAALCIGFMYLIGESIIRAVRRKDKDDRKTMLLLLRNSGIAFFRAFLYVTALNLTYTAFVQLYYQMHPLLYLALNIALAFAVNRFKILTNLWVLIAVGLYDTVMTVVTGKFVLILYWKLYLLVILMLCIRAFASVYNYEAIPTQDVRAGMVLSRADSILMNNYHDEGLPGVSDETLRSRLTQEEAQSVRRWGRSKYGKPQIMIVRKVPFAAFLSLGMLLYITMGVLQYCGLV